MKYKIILRLRNWRWVVEESNGKTVVGRKFGFWRFGEAYRYFKNKL